MRRNFNAYMMMAATFALNAPITNYQFSQPKLDMNFAFSLLLMSAYTWFARCFCLFLLFVLSLQLRAYCRLFVNIMLTVKNIYNQFLTITPNVLQLTTGSV